MKIELYFDNRQQFKKLVAAMRKGAWSKLTKAEASVLEDLICTLEMEL